MKKIILSLFLMLNFLFAQVDANLEVVKKANTLPTILVSLSSDSSEIETLNKIKNVLIKDLEVSGHFKISNFQNIVKYEEKPDLNILNEQKIDLFLNLTAKKVTNGSYVLSSKLFDIV